MAKRPTEEEFSMVLLFRCTRTLILTFEPVDEILKNDYNFMRNLSNQHFVILWIKSMAALIKEHLT